MYLNDNEELKETIKLTRDDIIQLTQSSQFVMKKGIEDNIEQKLKSVLDKKKNSVFSLSYQSKSTFKNH